MQNFQKIKKKIKKKKLGGFSLLEMLVSIMIFSLVILASVAAFTSVTRTQKKTREIQKKVESIGVVMELMSKVVRMSSQVSSHSGDSEIRMYNDSQSECISYKFSGGGFQMAEKVVAGYDPNTGTACTGNYTGYTTIISGVTGRFKVYESDPSTGKVGKAIVTIQAGQDHLQSSVSFMDAY